MADFFPGLVLVHPVSFEKEADLVGIAARLLGVLIEYKAERFGVEGSDRHLEARLIPHTEREALRLRVWRFLVLVDRCGGLSFMGFHLF